MGKKYNVDHRVLEDLKQEIKMAMIEKHKDI
jgi:hypothetical protein